MAEQPTQQPTQQPAQQPTQQPTQQPAQQPAQQPTQQPTVKATVKELEIRQNPSARNNVKYFVSITPSDTFSVCEKDYYLGLENKKVVFFDVKDNYIIEKEMFDFLSAHQNGIFKFEIKNVTIAPDTSNTIPAIISATLIC